MSNMKDQIECILSCRSVLCLNSDWKWIKQDQWPFYDNLFPLLILFQVEVGQRINTALYTVIISNWSFSHFIQQDIHPLSQFDLKWIKNDYNTLNLSLKICHFYIFLSVSGQSRTKDKYRVVYSDHQRLELEKEFHYSRYITIRRKAELAQALSLSERQVSHVQLFVLKNYRI